MEPEFFGIEGITDEDRAYKGSRFAEVRDAIFANPYQKIWGRAGEPPLPVYKVTTRSFVTRPTRAPGAGAWACPFF